MINYYKKNLPYKSYINEMSITYNDIEEIQDYQSIIEIGYISNIRNGKIKLMQSIKIF